MSTTHYVARVVIERVDHLDVRHKTAINVSTATDDTRRVVTQLASFTVRDDGLAGIITKVPKHLELIDDIEAIDPVNTEKPKVTR